MNKISWNRLRTLSRRGSFISPRPALARKAYVCCAALICLLCSSASADPGKANGTLVHKSRTVTLGYAYLIKGPDAIDTKTIIRRLVLTGKDIGGKIHGCKTMSCVDGEVTEGLIVDLTSGPRLGYWMALNNGLVQHSGTLRPTVLEPSVNDAKRLAGKLSFDDTSAGGPKVEASFDAPMLKEFTAAR